MSKIGTLLLEIKTKLQTIPNISSVKIGMEKGIGSKDSPFIRIIPETNTEEKLGRSCDRSGGMDALNFDVVFGFDLKNQELEALYQEFYDLEETIRSTILSSYTSKGHAVFEYTMTDEDKLMNIKSAISRFKIKGIR